MTDLSVDAPLLTGRSPELSINGKVAALAAAILFAGATALMATISWRQGALYLLGGALGVSLYHALFGFTSAWRVFIADRRGAGLRAQMIMLAVAVVLFFPPLGQGELFGQPVHGEYGAVGVGMLTGAFLFGLGMQLGGGCASGTLYSAGGGNTRMLVTLAAFIAGSPVGAKHLSWWSALPNIGTVPLIEKLGMPVALGLSLILMAGIFAATVWLEKQRHGRLLPGARRRGPGLAAPYSGTVATGLGRGRLSARKFRDAVPGRTTLGHNLGVGIMWIAHI